jgi:hypothetical protein
LFARQVLTRPDALLLPPSQLAALEAYCSKAGLDVSGALGRAADAPGPSAHEAHARVLSHICSLPPPSLLQANKYTLMNGKAAVDLSLPYRLSGLAANAVLDLVPRAEGSATSGEVRVAMSFSGGVPAPSSMGAAGGEGGGGGAGGGRATLTVSAGSSLADVLVLSAQAAGLALDVPALASSAFGGCSVVYMRTSVSGAALATTTLAGLGISKGSVSLRGTLPEAGAGAPSAPAAEAVPVPAPAVAAAVAVPAPAPTISAVAMSIDNAAVAPAAPAPAPAPVAAPVAAPVPIADTAMTTEAAPPAPATSAAAAVSMPSAPSAPAPAPAPADPSAASAAADTDPRRALIRATGQRVRAALSKLRMAAFDSDAREALTVVVKILDTLVLRPGDARVRTVRLANPIFESKAGRFPGVLDVLRSVGFSDDVVAPGERALTLKAEAEDEELTQGVREMCAVEAAAVGANLPAAPQIDYALRERMKAEASHVAAVFDPFRAVVLKVGADDGTGKGGRPEVKVLGGGVSASPVKGTGAGAGAGAGVGTSSSPVVPGVPADDGLSSVERKVNALKARAAEIQQRGGLPDRATRAVLYDPTRGFNPARFSAAEAAGGSGDGAGAGAGAGSNAGAGAGAPVAEDEAMDPGDAGLQLSYMRRRMKSEKEKEVSGDATGRCGGALALSLSGGPGSLSPFPTFPHLMSSPTRSTSTPGRCRSSSSSRRPRSTPRRSSECRCPTGRSCRGPSARWCVGRRESCGGGGGGGGVIRAHSPLTRNLPRPPFLQEPLSSVYAWVRSIFLTPSSEPSSSAAAAAAASAASSSASALPPFFLYQTPPPAVVADTLDKTLGESKLQPAALLYLGWGTGLGARATGDVPLEPSSYLRPEILAAALAGGAADAAQAAAAAFPTAQPVVEAPAMDVDAAAAALLAGKGSGAGAGAGAAKAGAGAGAKGGKPSWLKL